jgi:SAM-dependent methyltransferase
MMHIPSATVARAHDGTAVAYPTPATGSCDVPTPALGLGFAAVDQAAAPRALVGYLEAVHALDSARAYKEESFNLLEPLDGAQLLEIGCGTGLDACELARRVGSLGRVFGVDSSRTMIDEAWSRSRTMALPVEFVLGDAHRLELPNEAFDGCRADRVLQHVEYPAQVVSEMTRVTRSGGRVVLAEPDWGTLVVDFDGEVSTQFVLSTRTAAKHATIGRQLPRLLRDAGLVALQLVPFTAVFPTVELADQVCGLRSWARRTADHDHTSREHVDRWLSALDAASSSGRFFAALTGFVAAGRKPGTPT